MTDLPEPAQRGTLTVAPRVVERIASYAAREVPGVQTLTESTLGLSVGPLSDRYPKAAAQLAGDRARVTVDIAVTWPAAVADVAAAVRDHVREQLDRLAGTQADRVDVVVAKLAPPPPTQERRVQ